MAKNYIVLGGIADANGEVRKPGDLVVDTDIGDAKVTERYLKLEAIRDATPAEVEAGLGVDPNAGPTFEQQIEVKQAEIESLKTQIKLRDAKAKAESEARAKAKAEEEAAAKAKNKGTAPVQPTA